MAGGIFQPALDSLAEISHALENPLLCYLCNEQFEEPCLLQCFHSFCARCLRGRAVDNRMSCPLCGLPSGVQQSDNLPPSDELLKFLVTSSSEDKIQCANCDQVKKVGETMFFCNTCSQPLCEACREDTHRARMFSKHEIVLLSQKTCANNMHKQCSKHKEPYIMFSIEKKAMMCINCFRELSMENRSHCIDLETAYSDCCQKLEQSVQGTQELQTSIQDGILQLRGLLEEILQSANHEREAILTLYGDLQQKLAAKKDVLLDEVERQFRSKERHFREQLVTLNMVLPTVRLHLASCANFSDVANKFQFLHMAHTIMDRLAGIAHLNLPLHPSHRGQINTNFRREFGRCLDSLLDLKELWGVADSNGKRSDVPSHMSLSSLSSPRMCATLTFTTDGGRKINGSGGNRVIVIEANGTFANHLKDFESKHRDVLQKYEYVKEQVQEVQRDLTLRRCMAKKGRFAEILNQCAQVQEDIVQHLKGAEKQRTLLEKHWEEKCQRISNEQEVYSAQVNDIVRIHQESQHLSVIAKQIAPFIQSITTVTEMISPRLAGESRSATHEDQVHAMFEQISSIEPDSQQRVEAIHAVEEDRQTQTANRVNPIDEELIKTKGMLKAPSARKEPKHRCDSESSDTPKYRRDSSCSSQEGGEAGKSKMNLSEAKQTKSESLGEPVDEMPRKRGSFQRDLGADLEVLRKEGVSLRELLCEEIVQRGECASKKEKQRDNENHKENIK